LILLLARWHPTVSSGHVISKCWSLTGEEELSVYQGTSVGTNFLQQIELAL